MCWPTDDLALTGVTSLLEMFLGFHFCSLHVRLNAAGTHPYQRKTIVASIVFGRVSVSLAHGDGSDVGGDVG